MLKSANEEYDLEAIVFLGLRERITHAYLALLTALMMTTASFARSITLRVTCAAILSLALL
jgi:hypothetical protein